jgi:hypothetical protein
MFHEWTPLSRRLGKSGTEKNLAARLWPEKENPLPTRGRKRRDRARRAHSRVQKPETAGRAYQARKVRKSKTGKE